MRAAVAAALAAGLAAAYGGEAPAQSWREEWSEHGLDFGGSFVAEVLRSTRGKNWPARLDTSAWVEMDLGEITGWQPFDHWYAFAMPTLAWGEEENWRWKARMYQAWLKWDGSDSWNVLAGLYDPSWDFHSLPSTSPFLRLPSRIGGEFSPGGIGLLDMYPLAAPALRIEVKPSPGLTLQAAALTLDSDYEIRGRRLLAGSGSSGLFLAEAAWHKPDDDAGHLDVGIGGWLLTRQRSWGLYSFVDTTLWHERTENGRELSAFVSGSVAGGRDIGSEWRIASGLSFRGLLPGRVEDITAIALIREKRGADNAATAGHRTAWELLHRVPLAADSWLQLTLQQMGAFDATSGDDWRIGLTFGADF